MSSATHSFPLTPESLVSSPALFLGSAIESQAGQRQPRLGSNSTEREREREMGRKQKKEDTDESNATPEARLRRRAI